MQQNSFLRTIIGGFIGGLILWAIVYGILHYTSLFPEGIAGILANVLSVPGQVIGVLIKVLKEKANISFLAPDWFFIEPISWGIVGALVSLITRIIRY